MSFIADVLSLLDNLSNCIDHKNLCSRRLYVRDCEGVIGGGGSGGYGGGAAAGGSGQDEAGEWRVRRMTIGIGSNLSYFMKQDI